MRRRLGAEHPLQQLVALQGAILPCRCLVEHPWGPTLPLFQTSPISNKAALEVGHITFLWAEIDSLVGEFMTHLMGLDANLPEAHILDGNMDIRDKIQATKGLAFLRHFDRQWLADTIAILDHIDNYLRPRRNSVIHSRWIAPKGRSLLTRTRKTKLIRPQAFQLDLETEQNVPVKLAELRRLRLDLQETMTGLLPVYWYMCDGDSLLDPATSPTLSWRRYLRLVGLGNPLRNVSAVRRRQRKPSRASPELIPR